jgi:hypothetical protein
MATPTLPNTTVADVIYAAYRIAGIIPDPGINPNPDETTDAFGALNAMLDDWNTHRLLVYQIQRVVKNYVAGKASYAIGPGAADWDMLRPPKIEQASTIINTDPTLPLEKPIAPLTWQLWQQVSIKATPSPLPTAFYYDAGFPIGNISFYPVPADSNYQVALYLWTLISPLQTTAQAISFPPAYLRAIQYNLALELADRFPLRAKPSPRTIEVARQSLQHIKSLNTPMLDMRCDAAALGRPGLYNWLTDQVT